MKHRVPSLLFLIVMLVCSCTFAADDCQRKCGSEKISGEKFQKCVRKCYFEDAMERKKEGEKKHGHECPSDYEFIPAGEFLMGSTSKEVSGGLTQKVLISKSFCLKKHEVTQGEWEEIMGSNPSFFRNCGKECPVENTSWEDIQVFIEKYNSRNEGKYRLPTEAEWEYAARAGTMTSFNTGGVRTLDDAGWYAGNSEVTYKGCEDTSNISHLLKTSKCAGTHPVGQKRANAWGLYDMHGNVWEWTSDSSYRYKSGEVVTDPTGPTSGSSVWGRVVRGGSWRSNALECRSDNRMEVGVAAPGINFVGFRLVKEISRQ